MLIRCVDFETTGQPTDEDPHAVCEVGYSDVTATFGDPIAGAVIAKFGEPWSSLTKVNRSMPADAQAVHHISDDDLAGAPLETTTAFMELMGTRTQGMPRPDYFCAHNADYEQAFFKGGGIPWICTFKVACRLYRDAPSHKLQVLRYWLDLDLDQAIGLPAHRAGPDAYVGAALMVRILEEPECPDLDTMVRWSKGPALLPRIGFGKHKGARWEDVDDGYLFWIIDKSDMDRDVKANAKHHLKLRERI